MEQQIATREQINSTSLLRAYIATQEAGNEPLDFSGNRGEVPAVHLHRA